MRLNTFRPLLPIVLLSALSIAVAVPGAQGGKRKPSAESGSDPLIEVVRVEEVPDFGPVFDGSLPVDAGRIPTGLANLSAQGCNACHYDAHDGWASSTHATGWSSEAFQDAARSAGTPACASCHLPLTNQHAQTTTYDGGDIHRPVSAPNPGFDPILRSEGVTCAACHVRDGRVLASRPVENAPHETVWSAQLGESALCATCHQLSWPGSEQPFYDTYGEWSRSAQSRAGVHCQDCHMRRTGLAPGSEHGFDVTEGRGPSLLVSVSSAQLTRGGEPTNVTLRVQNTGAGHSYPTGSPWKGIRLTATLAGITSDGERVEHGTPFTADFVRTVEEVSPWRTLSDTRLAAAEERTLSTQMGLALTAPSARWSIEITLHETRRGTRIEPPLLRKTVPLTVD